MPDDVIKTYAQNSDGSVAVTIPKEIREDADLKPGEHWKMDYNLDANEIVISPID